MRRVPARDRIVPLLPADAKRLEPDRTAAQLTPKPSRHPPDRRVRLIQESAVMPTQQPVNASPVCAMNAVQWQAPPRTRYLQHLSWAFTLFNSVRVLAYLPTLWAIHRTGDSNQHSLWTWATWIGANATMAAWLYEHNGQRLNRAVAVTLGNAGMCAVATLLIAWYRF
jgi:hypothetical protein